MDVHVELMDYPDNAEQMVCTRARNDYSDAAAWRTDYESLMEDAEGDTLEEKERNFLRHLMLRGHWGPFEHVQVGYGFRVSRTCMAQITRHRHATFDIQSMRYVDMEDLDPRDPDDFVYPPGVTEEELSTREGKKEFDIEAKHRLSMMQRAYKQALEEYKQLRNAGIPAEDARMVLPLGTKVNVTMSMNLRASFHILLMRGAGDAQAEIQQVADGMRECLHEAAPTVMDIWEENESAIKKQRLTP